MTKTELAIALSKALNLLNGINSEMNANQQKDYFDVLSCIPTQLLDRVDFYNNGEVGADDLTKSK